MPSDQQKYWGNLYGQGNLKNQKSSPKNISTGKQTNSQTPQQHQSISGQQTPKPGKVATNNQAPQSLVSTPVQAAVQPKRAYMKRQPKNDLLGPMSKKAGSQPTNGIRSQTVQTKKPKSHHKMKQAQKEIKVQSQVKSKTCHKTKSTPQGSKSKTVVAKNTRVKKK